MTDPTTPAAIARCLTESELESLQHRLEGTMEPLDQAIEAIGLDCIDREIIEDQLLDHPYPIELCKSCEWWFAVSSLNDDGLCEQCEPRDEE